MFCDARSSFLALEMSLPLTARASREVLYQGDDSLANHEIGKVKVSLLVAADKERARFVLLRILLGILGSSSGSKRALGVGESREVTKKKINTSLSTKKIRRPCNSSRKKKKTQHWQN